jgi:alkylation response protein AidB-like acyl-CoA dehydrogenase
MDFDLDEEQRAVRDLARRLLGAEPHAARPFSRETWHALGRAQLLGVALPESVGGSGSGIISLCLLLERAGAVASGLPFIPALVLAALPLTRASAAAPASELLQRVCSGACIPCGAFGPRGEPSIEARKRAGGWTLSGADPCVDALPIADTLVVAARTESGQRALFLLRADHAGVRIDEQQVASGQPFGRLQLHDVELAPDALLIEDLGLAGAVIDWTLERAYLAQCAYELGLSAQALHLTARYASERRQFGRAIGTFQAVAQRLADAHIALETMRLSLWRAAWLIDQARPAHAEIAVARTVACQAGHQIHCTAQHVHGGSGFDRRYPLHYYFLASQQNGLRLGGHGHHLARLGRLVAAEARPPDHASYERLEAGAHRREGLD